MVQGPSTNPAARLDEAQAALARGDLSTAEAIGRTLIADIPQNGRVWTILTETALQRNRLDAAIVCADRAVALSPEDPIAHVMRAKCMIAGGDARQARAEAEIAGAIGNASPEAEDAIGAIFGILGRHGQALDHCRRAVGARPDNPHFLFNLAASERVDGAFESAERHCDRAIAHERHLYHAYHLRSDLRTQTGDRNHIAEMESLVGQVRHWRGEVFLRYALGKECEDVRDYRRAFDHFRAGAALQRRHLSYDVRAEIALIDAVIETQGTACLDVAPAGFDHEAPIFIVGLPRSGTTLVERIIAGHHAVASAGELAALPLVLAREVGRMRRPTTPRDLSKAWLSIDPGLLGKRYVEAARASGTAPEGRFIDKFQDNVLHCLLLHRALPRAKIILLRRNPMDSCFAIYRTLFDGTYRYSYALAELAAYYLAFRRLADHWTAVLPSTALIEIAYEDLVGDPPGQARRLLDFLDMPWDESVLNFAASHAPSMTASAVQVRQPLYATSVGKWRHYADDLAPLREALKPWLPASEL